MTINVVFKPGTNIDQAQVLVQNRVSAAEPRLPQDVRALGLAVRKASPDLMMVVHMMSPDGTRDQQYISNYATLYVKDVLTRVDGVGNVQVFGARDYSMRVWLDPAKVAARNLTARRCRRGDAGRQPAGRGGRDQPAAGARRTGAFQLSVNTLGRLTAIDEFENIVVRAEPMAARSAVRDVARVELGAQDYTANAYLDNKNAVAHRHLPAPGLERAGHLRRADGDDGRAVEATSRSGVEHTDRLQPDRVHPESVGAVVTDAVRGGARSS